MILGSPYSLLFVNVTTGCPKNIYQLPLLEGTTDYVGLLLTPVRDFGLQTSLFVDLWAEQLLSMLVLPMLGPVSNNISNFEEEKHSSNQS